MAAPKPDKHGRYRVRRKGDTNSPAWSTRNFDPEKHVIVPGPASDTYGAAWPPKLHRRLEIEDADPQPNTDTQPNPDEETKA